MDGIYRKGHYQQLIQKLNLLQGAAAPPTQEDKNHFLQEEVNSIIESLRNRGDQSMAQIHYLLLIFPLFVALVWHGISSGHYYSDIMIALAVCAYLALAHVRMKKVILDSQKNVGSTSIQGSAREFIYMKINYLEKAMDIKKSRLLLIAMFYIFFFPILLVHLHTIAADAIAFDSTLMAYSVAYLIAGALWYIYFNRAFEIYDDIESSLDVIRANL